MRQRAAEKLQADTWTPCMQGRMNMDDLQGNRTENGGGGELRDPAQELKPRLTPR